jgi:VanZ family protein
MTFIPAVLLTVAIAVVSLWESPQVPVGFRMSDKLIHGLMYTLLAITWMIPVAHKRPSRRSPFILHLYYIITCVSVTLYGGLLEFLQHYCTRTRSGEWADFLADFIGALVGVLLVALLRYVVVSRARNHENDK